MSVTQMSSDLKSIKSVDMVIVNKRQSAGTCSAFGDGGSLSVCLSVCQRAQHGQID
jgi:hypothetical protein